jgi:hypothetical protein
MTTSKTKPKNKKKPEKPADDFVSVARRLGADEDKERALRLSPFDRGTASSEL